MTEQEQHTEMVTYFDTRYEVIERVPFVAEKRILLRDHDDEAHRRCRYCGRGKAEVQFKRDAHAVPDFLGNLSVFSMNECDSCNEYFGRGCEDHLSKQTMFARVLVGISRKKGKKSTFKNKDETLRIDADGSNKEIHLPFPNSVDDLLVDGKMPDVIPLTGDTASQPYVPIQAAMALVKIACSVCPKEHLGQCQRAIDWLMGRMIAELSGFPVFFACTPGPLNDNASEIVILSPKKATVLSRTSGVSCNSVTFATKFSSPSARRTTTGLLKEPNYLANSNIIRRGSAQTGHMAPRIIPGTTGRERNRFAPARRLRLEWYR